MINSKPPPSETNTDTVLPWWWVGPAGTVEHDGFLHWITTEAPRPAKSTWRVRCVEHDSLSLPRSTPSIAANVTATRSRPLGILVWPIPESGVADLIGRIAALRRTRPGHCHLTTGLVSPHERRFLCEIGVIVHVQHPGDWRRFQRVFSDWLG